MRMPSDGRLFHELPVSGRVELVRVKRRGRAGNVSKSERRCSRSSGRLPRAVAPSRVGQPFGSPSCGGRRWWSAARCLEAVRDRRLRVREPRAHAVGSGRTRAAQSLY
jgi:hypothetical protein